VAITVYTNRTGGWRLSRQGHISSFSTAIQYFMNREMSDFRLIMNYKLTSDFTVRSLSQLKTTNSTITLLRLQIFFACIVVAVAHALV